MLERDVCTLCADMEVMETDYCLDSIECDDVRSKKNECDDDNNNNKYAFHYAPPLIVARYKS